MERSIFYSMTERELFEPELSDRSLEDIRDKGFDAIYLEYRNTKCGFENPRFQRGVRLICRKADELGLKVFAHAHYRQINQTLIEECPEGFSDRIQPCYSQLINGRFTIRTYNENLHNRVEKCYLIERKKDNVIHSCTDITSLIVPGGIHTEGGGCQMTKGPAFAVTEREILAPEVPDGEVFVVVRYLYVYSSPDLSNPITRRYHDRMLEPFRDLPVQGFAMDEPHMGFDFFDRNSRVISDSLCGQFQRKYGYDLKDKLIHLWFDVEGEPSGLIRYHYSDLLEEALAADERVFMEKADALMKSKGIPDYFLGIHRTMHEETSDDLYIGSADYFRHNRYTSSGFTDSVYERDDSMINMLVMARSLAAVSKDKRAYNNSWGFRPTEEQNDYYLSLMAAMNVRWIGHTYHHSVLFGPGYPDTPLWDLIHLHLQEHKEALALLGGAVPVADTAVLYNWSSLTSFPDHYIHVHRRNLTLLAKTLTNLNRHFQYIGGEILEQAAFEEGVLVTEAGRFKRLIIPWADMMSRTCLNRVLAAAEQGVEILIFGPPANRCTDGTDCSDSFAELCGIERVDHNRCSCGKIGDLLQCREEAYALNPNAIQPNYGSNDDLSYPDHYKYYELNPRDGNTQTLGFIGDKPVAVANGSVVYFACELPHYEGLMGKLAEDFPLSELLRQLPEQLIAFEYTVEGGKAVAGLGAWNKPITSEFVWDDHRILLNNATFFAIRVAADGAARAVGDGVELVRLAKGFD